MYLPALVVLAVPAFVVLPVVVRVVLQVYAVQHDPDKLRPVPFELFHGGTTRTEPGEVCRGRAEPRRPAAQRVLLRAVLQTRVRRVLQARVDTLAGEPPTPQTSSLLRNLSWVGVGNVVRGACQWGTLAALAKFCPVQMVGQYALGLAVTAPI